MTITGVALAEVLRRWPHPKAAPVPMKPGNPFRIKPALRFGVLFTIVVFLAKAATAQLGAGAFYGTSLLGGLVDVATVIAPASDLLESNKIAVSVAALLSFITIYGDSATPQAATSRPSSAPAPS